MLYGIESGFNDCLDGMPVTVGIEKPVRSYHHIDVCRTRWNPQRELDELHGAALLGELLSGRLHHAFLG